DWSSDVCSSDLGEVLRYLDLARRGVQLDVYVQLIATRDSGLRAVVGAQADHELAAHGGDRAAVRVTVQRDGHRRALPSAKGLHDFRRNIDASGLPGSLHGDRPSPHGASVPTTPPEAALLERAGAASGDTLAGSEVTSQPTARPGDAGGLDAVR